MNNTIGGYQLLTAMQTTGSGSARWCMARRGTERYFLKEFLSPVWPANPDTAIGQRQMDRCIKFEKQKQQLYAAASCVLGDVLVPVVDFFRENGHYYAVSQAAPDGHVTMEYACSMSTDAKKKLLYDLAVALQRLHAQGIVHADLKPQHGLLVPDDQGWKIRLIDIDSGFLINGPARSEKEMEGDPVYLAPETFLCMIGQNMQPGAAADTFAFAAMIHQVWTGELPGFDRKRYHYLYEALLNDGDIHLSLPEEWQSMVNRMLSVDPSKRPSDAQIVSMFAPEHTQPVQMNGINGLSKLFKK